MKCLPYGDRFFLAGAEGLDSRVCGRLVARGHNSPPDCCSVPLVLQVLLLIKIKQPQMRLFLFGRGRRT